MGLIHWEKYLAPVGGPSRQPAARSAPAFPRKHRFMTFADLGLGDTAVTVATLPRTSWLPLQHLQCLAGGPQWLRDMHISSIRLLDHCLI